MLQRCIHLGFFSSFKASGIIKIVEIPCSFLKTLTVGGLYFFFLSASKKSTCKVERQTDGLMSITDAPLELRFSGRDTVVWRGLIHVSRGGRDTVRDTVALYLVGSY